MCKGLPLASASSSFMDRLLIFNELVHLAFQVRREVGNMVIKDRVWMIRLDCAIPTAPHPLQSEWTHWYIRTDFLDDNVFTSL